MLLAGNGSGNFDYFENTGDATTPLFTEPLGNPFGIGGIGSDAAPTFGDLDHDGDLDLAVGQYYGGFAYFENTGSRTTQPSSNEPAWRIRSTTSAPRYYYASALADFDADSDLDLVAGASSGRLFHFENVGTSSSPKFEPRTGAANPLDGEDVGSRSAPAAADLNADGDPDLVTGSLAGSFSVHYFPEPGRGLLLGAGLALLGLLERLHRRRDR